MTSRSYHAESVVHGSCSKDLRKGPARWCSSFATVAFLTMFLFAGNVWGGNAWAGNQSGARPNILFILVDDLGKEWISCYGAETIRTPHIDALAAGGMRFENAYSMPQCTPTRVTLLTGQYPFHHGWTNHWDVPRWGSGGHFDPRVNVSFARVLRRAGYATAIAGKWQIDDFRVEPRALDEAGFDAWCVWTGGEGGNPTSDKRYWDPYIHQGNQSRTHAGRFGPDLYCQFLIDFLRAHRDQPLLLYYPMTLTHGPLVTTPDEPEAKTKIDRHKAMVRYTDKLVGRLVAALDEQGLREKTIIFFTTDNGTGGGIQGSLRGRAVRGAKSKSVEAGTAMPFIVNGPGRVPAGIVTDALTDFTDILPTFAELAGVERSAIGQALSSEPAPGSKDGSSKGSEDSPKITLDGRSIAPLLLGQADDSQREWIVSVGGGPATFRDNRVVPVEAFDDRVIRDKRWKLWVSTDRRPVALYDLREDPWEQRNLIDSESPAARAAKKRLWAVVQRMPKQDAAPRYTPNPAQAWDKFPYREKP